LEKRRELIAKVIYDGYRRLKSDHVDKTTSTSLSLSDLIKNGETHMMEFKATLRTNLHTNQRDPRMEFSVLRTIAGFLNNNGGTLTIGVFDDGSPAGIEVDGFENEDKMSLHLINLMKSRLGVLSISDVHIHFEDFQSCRIMVVECGRSTKPIYYKDGENDRFFIRTGPSTTELSTKDAIEYQRERF
ncbi:MAG TPA: ATP-binding protein, partial [Cyclobacteriaceae bacterium]|nr:ATP-binding protein [Cyclobacteriaceae bacterium]